jgi:hypothetical protein
VHVDSRFGFAYPEACATAPTYTRTQDPDRTDCGCVADHHEHSGCYYTVIANTTIHMLTLGDLEGPDRVRGSVGLGVVSCTSQPFCGMKSWGKTVSESGVAESRAYAVSNNGGGGKIPNPPTNREKCYRSKIIPRFDMERVLKAIMSLSRGPGEKYRSEFCSSE